MIKNIYYLLAVHLLFISSCNQKFNEYDKQTKFYSEQDSITVAQMLIKAEYHFENTGHFAEIRNILDSIHLIAKEKKLLNTSLYADALCLEGSYWQMKDNNSEKAIKFIAQAIAIGEQALPENDPQLAIYYGNIGYSYWDNNNFSEAKEYFEKALIVLLPDSINQAHNISRIYLNIARIYRDEGQFEKSLVYAYNALDINTKTFGSNHANTGEMYNSIASIVDEMKDYKKAIEFREKALRIYESSSEETSLDLGITHGNLGVLYIKTKDYNKAIYHYRKAEIIYKELNGEKSPRYANVLGNIGDYFNNIGNHDSSLYYHHKSLEILIAAKGENNRSVATGYGVLAVVHKNLKNYQDALKLFQKSIAIRKDIFGIYSEYVSNDFRDIAELHSLLGNHQVAFVYLDSFVLVRDSIWKLTRIQTQEELKEKLDVANKDLQIALLDKENEIKEARIVQQRKNYISVGIIITLLIIFVFSLYIFSQIKVKAELKLVSLRNSISALSAQMNPHAVSSFMNSIMATLTKNDIKTSMVLVEEFASLSRKTLEMSQEEVIEVSKEILFITQYLELEKLRVPNLFDFQIKASEEALHANFPTMLLQPVLENCVRHGFNAIDYKGNINIDFFCQDNFTVCIVEDNGIGRLTSELNKPWDYRNSYSYKIIKSKIDAYNSIKENTAAFNILDLDTGTKVELKYKV